MGKLSMDASQVTELSIIEALDFDHEPSCDTPMGTGECNKPAEFLMIRPCGHDGYRCGECVEMGRRLERTLICVACYLPCAGFRVVPIKGRS